MKAPAQRARPATMASTREELEAKRPQIEKVFGRCEIEERGNTFLLRPVSTERPSTARWFDALKPSGNGAADAWPDETPQRAKSNASSIVLLNPPADILTCTFPPREYVAGPYGALGATTALIGEGAVGKSKFLRMLMLHAAAGLPFLGHATTPGRYVYLSAEDEIQEVWRDVQHIVRGLPAESQELALKNFHLIDAVGRGLHFIIAKDGVAEISATVDRIAEAVGTARMVAIDTLSRVNGCEENSNATMSMIESACARIAARSGASVWLTHHVAKSVAREGIADLHSGRGGSALGDNARGVLRLMPASAADVRQITGILPGEIERGDIVRLLHPKNSYGRRAEPVWLRRMADGLLEQFTPERKNEAADAATMLDDFVVWWEGSGRKPFTKTAVCRTAAAHGHLQSIWPRGVSEAMARNFFETQLGERTFIATSEKARGGAVAYTLNHVTAESLLNKATAAERAAEAAWDEETADER